MNFAQLTIKNFLTIGDASFDLDSRGLLLIQGVNNDDTSAASNGAGKSSVVDAICWALYGTTARDVTGDDVINDKAKKDCSVSVTIEDGDDAYIIRRYRKDSKHKNQLLAYRVPNAGTTIDLSKGTDKETQEVVNKIIGCSLDVFIGSIYAGQEKMPDLPNMTDKQLKLLIEEAAGVEELADAYAEARKRMQTAQSKVAIEQSAVKTLEIQLASAKDAVTRTEKSVAEFDTGRSERAREELKAVVPLQASKTEAEAKIAAADKAALEEKKAKLEKDLSEYKAKSEILKTLNAEERAASTKLERFGATVKVEKAGVERMEDALRKIESQVGTPCGECGKTYCEHDLEAAKVARQQAITLQKKKLLEAATGMKEAKAAHELAAKAAAEQQAKLTDLSDATAALSAVMEELNGLDKHSRFIAEVDAKISAIKVAAKAKMTEVNPWIKALESQKQQVIDLEKAIAAKAAEIVVLEDEAEIFENAVAVFGPAGVRAHILDTVTPFLNDRTGEYLDALSDGNIHAVWSTLAKTSKGDMREKFNIEVVNDKGGKSFKAISGGEKRKVRLACAMALQDMVASRASKPINLFMADEIDHALDEPGLERLMTVLEKKAKERGTVMIVSHNSLADWCDQTITITKNGGVSTVSGANQRGY